MKISELLRILKDAKREFGDVNAYLLDAETGNWINIKEILKLHPYTGEYGCMNRNDPVNAIGITAYDKNAPDLVLN